MTEINTSSTDTHSTIGEIIEKYCEQENIEKQKTISEWLLEEGFDIEKPETKKEYFRVIAKKNTEKVQSQYVFELADYGKRISNIKILIL